MHGTNVNVCEIDIAMPTLQGDDSIKLSNHHIGNKSNNTLTVAISAVTVVFVINYGSKNITNMNHNRIKVSKQRIIQSQNGTNIKNTIQVR